ncbi:MAG: biotin--[acetyl-CoA-carboxylase] ligase [Alistipes sp.]|nr:biotin--[acetyl-CoA-carboxylase] ligase [Alistipes sp.]
MLYYKTETTSTNDDARDRQYGHMDIIWAEHQTSGRGQRGHSWHSHSGENITFSIILTPTFLPATEQFLISEIAALALVDTLKEYDIECRIKWTNDIYAGDNKIVGILIEHTLAGMNLSRTVIGIGLNVNQLSFPEELPNPTSMAVERGITFDRREILDTFSTKIAALYDLLESGQKEAIESRYRMSMYHRDEQHTYAYADGVEFRATIRGVRPSGELCLEHEDGIVREYAFKEVEFVLPHKVHNKA